MAQTDVATIRPEVLDLDIEAARINQAHEECMRAGSEAVDRTFEVGRLLCQARAKRGHGEWLPWVEDQLMFGIAQADNYLLIYEHREAIKVQIANGICNLNFSGLLKAARRINRAIARTLWRSDEVLTGTATVAQMAAVAYLAGREPEEAKLLLTDPPYMTDVEDIGDFARSWLSLGLSRVAPTGRAYIFIGAYPEELDAYLDAYYRPRAGATPHAMRLDMVLPWVYRNTIGPAPADRYKLNWQACLFFQGPEAPPLNAATLVEQFSVQDVNAPDGRHGMRLHAWEKPAELAERFIRHATKPGDLVLDPFAGTGTFLAEAARLGRHAIGCDVDAAMIDLCERRGISV